jgi:hypothetical protein
VTELAIMGRNVFVFLKAMATTDPHQALQVLQDLLRGAGGFRSPRGWL